MDRVVTCAQMTQAESYTVNTVGVHMLELMKRAGEGIAQEVFNVINRLKAHEVTVVCGPGNNGGDGYVCARLLHQNGMKVKVYAIGDALSENCIYQRNFYNGDYTKTLDGEIIVDCIFGTGLNSNVDGEYRDVIKAINTKKLTDNICVISVDIPSGLNGDNGKVMGVAIKADMTIAIGEYKFGHFLNDAKDYCGMVVKKDIGVIFNHATATVYFDADVKNCYPQRLQNSTKFSYGAAEIIGLDCDYKGASIMSMLAALRTGCGYVKYVTNLRENANLPLIYPQPVYYDEFDLSAQAIALGMGMGIKNATYQKIKLLLKSYEGTLIIDADGLNCLAKFGIDILKEKKTCKVILTPHAVEFARLAKVDISTVKNNPVNAATKFARELDGEQHVIVLLKGPSTIITDGVNVGIVNRGNSALAKAGSGDMLAGIIAGGCARGLFPFDGCVCGAYTMGLAAEMASEELGEYSVTAEDIINYLPKAIKYLTM